MTRERETVFHKLENCIHIYVSRLINARHLTLFKYLLVKFSKQK